MQFNIAILSISSYRQSRSREICFDDKSEIQKFAIWFLKLVFENFAKF